MDTTTLSRVLRARADTALVSGFGFIVLGIGACVAICGAYWSGWPATWISWGALGVASIGFWWQWRIYRAIQFLAWQSGVRIDDGDAGSGGATRRPAGNELIFGARNCLSVAGNGGELPELEDDTREHLIGSYGETWLLATEELLRAMLAFVEDFRAFAGSEGAELREMFDGDPRENCLLNMFQCMVCAGAFSQPTLQSGKPSLSAFSASFGICHASSDEQEVETEVDDEDEFSELSRAGTCLILAFAVSFANEVLKQSRAA